MKQVCPITGREVEVVGIRKMGAIRWWGCLACRFVGGFVIKRQWHPLIEKQTASAANAGGQ